MRDSYISRFLPRDQVELDLVDRMVHATWTLRRCWTIETELMNLQMLRMEAQLAAEYDNFPERTRIAAAFDELAKQPALPLLNRYGARLANEYQRALRTLMELRKNVPLGPADDVAETNCQTNPTAPSGAPKCRYTQPTGTDNCQPATDNCLTRIPSSHPPTTPQTSPGNAPAAPLTQHPEDSHVDLP